MIALSKVDPPDDLAAEVRRRVGGRELLVSEYATRLVETIDSLVGLVEVTRQTPGEPRPWTDGELDQALELDGRIEALRIRLGIDAIAIQPYEPKKQRNWSFYVVGYSQIKIRQEDDEPEFADKWIHPIPDDHWYMRMKSMRAIAQELAIAPELDPEEEAIVGLIVATGRRLTTTQILDEFSKRGAIKAESTVKGKLAQLTKRKVLVNRSDTNPKGYGLPEWV